MPKKFHCTFAPNVPEISGTMRFVRVLNHHAQSSANESSESVLRRDSSEDGNSVIAWNFGGKDRGENFVSDPLRPSFTLRDQ